MDIDLLLHTRCFPQHHNVFQNIYDKRYLDAYGPSIKRPPLNVLPEQFKNRYRDAATALTAQLSVDPGYPSASWNPSLTFNSVFSIDSFNEPCIQHTFDNVFVPRPEDRDEYQYTPKLANTLYLPESDDTRRDFSDLLKCQRTGGEPNVLTPEQYLAMMKTTIKNMKIKMQATEYKLSRLSLAQREILHIRVPESMPGQRRARPIDLGPLQLYLARTLNEANG